MPKEILDVIDTAVKIGLGALISGISTYQITKRNHTHENTKNSKDKKIEILECVSEEVEPYLTSFHALLAKSFVYVTHDNKVGPIIANSQVSTVLNEMDVDLINKRGDMYKAKSKLKLIGLNDVIEKLEDLGEIEDRFREEIIFNKVLPTEEELSKYSTNYRKYKNNYELSLQKSFEGIYK